MAGAKDLGSITAESGRLNWNAGLSTGSFRDIYLLTTAAESEEDTPKRAESGLQGWIDCYEKSALKAHLFCGGVNDSREINGNPKLQEAFELGKNV